MKFSTPNLFAGDIFKDNPHALPEAALGPSVYVGSAVVNLLALALPLSILQIYDRVLPNASFDTLSVLIAALIGVLVVDLVLKYCRAYYVNWTAASFTHKLSTRALNVMMSSSPSRFGRAPASEHLERLNSVFGLGDYLGGQSRVVSIDILFIPIFASVIILVGGPIFFAPLILFGIFGYFAIKRTKNLSATISEKEEQDSRKYDFIIEILKSVQTIKSLAMEPLMMRRFERLQAASSVVVKRLVGLTNETQNFSALYSAMSATTIVFVGALLVLNGRLTIGGLACCMLLSSQLLQPLLRSLSAWNESRLADHRRDRVEDIFDNASALRQYNNEIEHTQLYNAEFSPKAVALKDVVISYGEGPALFENATMNAAPGEMIAIKGGNGCGRTSLLRTMIGDVTPKTGEIHIDETLIDEVAASSLRAAVRYVGQTPTTFRGTILENLTLFGALPAATALWASKLIGLDHEVIRMPLGYDTPLRSSSGRDIPAATAQRICIARALATKPAILLLDEANASLDIQGERQFIEALKQLRGSMTIILAAQRPSLIALADAAYEIRDRKVVPSPPQPSVKEAARR